MSGKEKRHLTVKELPEEMRPRERLFEQGATGLSDVELIAIVIRTGTRDQTSLQLAGQLLEEFGSLGKMSYASLEELSEFQGIGRAKAAQLIACVELGKRVFKAGLDVRRPITSPEQLASLLMLQTRDLDREHFKAVILNTKNHVLKIVDISIGSLNSSIVHPRELFKMVLKHSGAALIVAHNHPSGDPEPSSEDMRLTKRLSEAGKILGIDLLDHLILGDGRFVSLKERGII